MPFYEFLIGTVLVSSLVLLALLVSPKPAQDVKTRSIPWMVSVVAVLFLVLGMLGAITLTG